jgi:hypothetical protein
LQKESPEKVYLYVSFPVKFPEHIMGDFFREIHQDCKKSAISPWRRFSEQSHHQGTDIFYPTTTSSFPALQAREKPGKSVPSSGRIIPMRGKNAMSSSTRAIRPRPSRKDASGRVKSLTRE